MTDLVLNICGIDFNFSSFEEINPFFKRVINQIRQMNYTAFQSETFYHFEAGLQDILSERNQHA